MQFTIRIKNFLAVIIIFIRIALAKGRSCFGR